MSFPIRYLALGDTIPGLLLFFEQQQKALSGSYFQGFFAQAQITFSAGTASCSYLLLECVEATLDKLEWHDQPELFYFAAGLGTLLVEVVGSLQLLVVPPRTAIVVEAHCRHYIGPAIGEPCHCFVVTTPQSTCKLTLLEISGNISLNNSKLP